MEIITDTLQTLDTLVQKLTTLPPALSLVVFLIMAGYLLKGVRQFPNRLIPRIVVPLGAILAPFFVDWPTTDKIGTGIRFIAIGAWVQIGVKGALLGFGAWISHAQLLKKWIDPKIFNGHATEKPLDTGAPVEEKKT